MIGIEAECETAARALIEAVVRRARGTAISIGPNVSTAKNQASC
jgi:hypothetical protein